jgi:hypothetical protein
LFAAGQLTLSPVAPAGTVPVAMQQVNNIFVGADVASANNALQQLQQAAAMATPQGQQILAPYQVTVPQPGGNPQVVTINPSNLQVTIGNRYCSQI